MTADTMRQRSDTWGQPLTTLPDRFTCPATDISELTATTLAELDRLVAQRPSGSEPVREVAG